MRIYISGSISGRAPEEYRAAFNEAAGIIRRAGHEAVNPVDVSGWGLTWGTYMQIAADVINSGEVDAVYMLEGWEASFGACLERYFAVVKGIPVWYQAREDGKKYGRRCG